MKATTQLRILLIAFIGTFLISCGGNRYANTGTASDRTGLNGATNGNGKAPTDNTHNYRPR